MILRLISIYLRSLFALIAVLILVTLSINIGALLGGMIPFAPHDKALAYCAFGILAMVFGLAKDRNIWRNEFKSCPKWLRGMSLAVAIYGMIGAFAWLLSFKSSGSSVDLQLCTSSLFLSFESMSICILYALLWGEEISPGELCKRIRISFVMLAIFGVIAAATMLGLFPHPVRQQQ